MRKIIMKNLRNLVLLVATMAIISSCKEEAVTNECSGTPVITKISSTTDRLEAKTGGSLSDWIIIQGSNLCGAKDIMFNDVAVDLTNAYITSNEITVAIPRGIPTVTNNMLTVKSNGGEATFGYTVAIPPLQVVGMYNEYTPAGGTMAITGKNFDLYRFTPADGKVLFGTTEVAIERSTPDSIFFKVPLTATANTKLKLKDKRGVETTVPGQYQDNRGLIYDMSGSFWNSARIIQQDGPVPAPIAGRYTIWRGDYRAWVWNEAFHIVSNPRLSDFGVIGSANNFVIKFEINTLRPWARNPLNIKFLNITRTFAPYTNLPFITDGWKTLTIPLNIFLVGGVPINITQAQASAQTELRVYIHGPAADSYDLAIDNFRIVPVD